MHDWSSDWVIQAQVGHVALEMMKTFSHIRRQALNQAADALEPYGSADFSAAVTPDCPTLSSSNCLVLVYFPVKK
jgi:hypothetical protein